MPPGDVVREAEEGAVAEQHRQPNCREDAPRDQLRAHAAARHEDDKDEHQLHETVEELRRGRVPVARNHPRRLPAAPPQAVVPAAASNNALLTRLAVAPVPAWRYDKRGVRPAARHCQHRAVRQPDNGRRRRARTHVRERQLAVCVLAKREYHVARLHAERRTRRAQQAARSGPVWRHCVAQELGQRRGADDGIVVRALRVVVAQATAGATLAGAAAAAWRPPIRRHHAVT
mmetsp:Transcript_24639/g.85713  ORF Transcript_24639/g.85713 Transcript_24639/m.85713 type:complete len:231 (+) Transcript_24639:1523-2215(+)